MVTMCFIQGCYYFRPWCDMYKIYQYIPTFVLHVLCMTRYSYFRLSTCVHFTFGLVTTSNLDIPRFMVSTEPKGLNGVFHVWVTHTHDYHVLESCGLLLSLLFLSTLSQFNSCGNNNVSAFIVVAAVSIGTFSVKYSCGNIYISVFICVASVSIDTFSV